MAATWMVPEGDLYSIFEDYSDGVLLVDSAAEVLYRNKALEGFPSHLEDRVLQFCGAKQCGCNNSTHENLLESVSMEGWCVACRPLGENTLITIKFDDKLSEKIQILREGFAKEIADGVPPAMAAMQILRRLVTSRWIAIGVMDKVNGCIDFDLCYDHDSLQRDAMPPLFRKSGFDACHSIALSNNPADFFSKTEPLKAMGISHLIGLSLRNHRDECVGYALLGDDHDPENVRESVALLGEVAALYGPYFEVQTAQRETRKAVADAHTDIVTGHGNRRAFEAFLQECLADMRHEQEESEVLSMFDPNSMRNSLLMLIDFDGFKRINDVMGHDEGDRALRLVSDALSRIDADSRVFRLGGDELVQVFPRAGNLEAEDLRQHVNIIETQMEEDGFDALGLSMGVVHFFEGEGSFASLLALADARMYHDKRMRSVAFV